MNLRVKEIIRRGIHMLPAYRREVKRLGDTPVPGRVEEQVKKYISDVPYYRSRYGAMAGEDFELSTLPLLTKADIVGHEREFISDKVNKRLCRHAETGGSSGMSLSLTYSLSALARKDALPDSLIRRYCGGSGKIVVGMLRGVKPRAGEIAQKINSRLVLLSSYALLPENVDAYVNALVEHKVNCLHVYPSSVAILARLIKYKHGDIQLPHLKCIFASSEVFDHEDKELVSQVFKGVPVIDYYSLSELCCAAHSVDDGPYEFNPHFGHVEFLETDQVTAAGNKVCDIVATGLINDGMPLVRYVTGDQAEIDSRGRVLSILGRTSEYVYNNREELMPCMILTRSESMKNVLSFQYCQPRHGELEFHVTVTPQFGDDDYRLLMEDMEQSYPSRLMKCNVVVKDELQKTRLGKLRRLVTPNRQ